MLDGAVVRLSVVNNVINYFGNYSVIINELGILRHYALAPSSQWASAK